MNVLVCSVVDDSTCRFTQFYTWALVSAVAAYREICLLQVPHFLNVVVFLRFCCCFLLLFFFFVFFFFARALISCLPWMHAAGLWGILFYKEIRGLRVLMWLAFAVLTLGAIICLSLLQFYAPVQCVTGNSTFTNSTVECATGNSTFT